MEKPNLILFSGISAQNHTLCQILAGSSPPTGTMDSTPISANFTLVQPIVPTGFVFCNHIDELPIDWQAFLERAPLTLQPPYLAALQQTTAEHIEHRFVLFTAQNQPIGFALMQMFYVNGNVINRRDSQEPQPISAWYEQWTKKMLTLGINHLNTRLLVVGNMLTTGQHGYYFAPSVQVNDIHQWVQKAISEVIQQEKLRQIPISIVLCKDYTAPELPTIRQITAPLGYTEIISEQNMVLQNQWTSFDNYLQCLTSKYRVRAKGVIKKGNVFSRKTLTINDLAENRDLLFQYYKLIIDQAKFVLTQASPQYLEMVQAQLGRQFAVIGYYYEQRLVGFISMFITPEQVEAHLIGYDQELNKEFGIYNNILYDVLKLGIENNVSAISYGRTAQEIKSTVGASGEEMNVFVKHQSCWFNNFVPYIATKLQPPNWVQRHPFKSAEEE